MNKSTPRIRMISDVAARWVAKRDSGLAVHEQVELERWLAADPRHQSAFEHYAKTWSVFDRPSRRGTAEAVMHEMGAHLKRKHTRRNQLAAACAVLLIGTFALWQWPRLAAVNPMQMPPGAMVLRPERRTLPDGSVIELKPGANISVQYSDTVRHVALLEGEAHFQVAKDASRPFLVETSGVEVRAIGTAFAVQRGGSQVEILVTEGRVAVEKAVQYGTTPAASLEDSSLAMLGAGERVVVDVGSASIASSVQAVEAAELNERLAWRAPRLEFSSTPLTAAVALMNRSLPAGSKQVRIVIDPASASLGSETVSGLFRADKPEAFARVLELSMGLRPEYRGDEIILQR